MKAWRRSSSSSQHTVAPPEILTATDVGGGGTTVELTFDQPVTYTGGTIPEFIVDGNPGDAAVQVSPTIVRIDILGGFGGGSSYSWSGPATHLVPTPDSSQTGLVT